MTDKLRLKAVERLQKRVKGGASRKKLEAEYQKILKRMSK